MKAAGTPRFLWLDVETTGLSPEDDLLLEVAALPSRSENPLDVNPADLRSWVVHVEGGELGGMLSATTWEMHGKSGLLAECATGGVSLDTVERGLIALVRESAGGFPVTWHLAGNSVHFDLGFARAKLPSFAHYLSHRVLDVSSLLLVARSSLVGAEISKTDPAHRSREDVLQSIELFKMVMHAIRTVH